MRIKKEDAQEEQPLSRPFAKRPIRDAHDLAVKQEPEVEIRAAPKPKREREEDVKKLENLNEDHDSKKVKIETIEITNHIEFHISSLDDEGVLSAASFSIASTLICPQLRVVQHRFRLADNDGRKCLIELDSTHPYIFETFVHWLNFGELPMQKDILKNRYMFPPEYHAQGIIRGFDGSWDLLMDLYLLGTKLDAVAFRDEIMTMWIVCDLRLALMILSEQEQMCKILPSTSKPLHLHHQTIHREFVNLPKALADSIIWVMTKSANRAYCSVHHGSIVEKDKKKSAVIDSIDPVVSMWSIDRKNPCEFYEHEELCAVRCQTRRDELKAIKYGTDSVERKSSVASQSESEADY